MSDFAMAGSSGMVGWDIVAMARAFIRNWRARRTIARLDACEDFILRDIGLTRDDLRWAADLPLRIDATAALSSRASVSRARSA